MFWPSTKEHRKSSSTNHSTQEKKNTNAKEFFFFFLVWNWSYVEAKLELTSPNLSPNASLTLTLTRALAWSLTLALALRNCCIIGLLRCLFLILLCRDSITSCGPSRYLQSRDWVVCIRWHSAAVTGPAPVTNQEREQKERFRSRIRSEDTPIKRRLWGSSPAQTLNHWGTQGASPSALSKRLVCATTWLS